MNRTLDQALTVIAQACDAVLGAPGLESGFIQICHNLEEGRGKKQQQGFDIAHKRTSAVRIGAFDGKKFHEASGPEFGMVVAEVFEKLKKDAPALVMESVIDLEAPIEQGLHGRATLKVVCASCCRCGEEKADRWFEGPRTHVRLGRALAPVTLMFCDKCADKPKKEKQPKGTTP